MRSSRGQYASRGGWILAWLVAAASIAATVVLLRLLDTSLGGPAAFGVLGAYYLLDRSLFRRVRPRTTGRRGAAS